MGWRLENCEFGIGAKLTVLTIPAFSAASTVLTSGVVCWCGRGQPNNTALPRHMLCLGWCSTANPAGNVTAGGERVETTSDGKYGTQTFSGDAEAQLTARNSCEGIDRAQEFVSTPVDHWGHAMSEGLQLGPARNQFWMTTVGEEHEVPATLAAAAPWVVTALDGRGSLRTSKEKGWAAL